MNSRVLRRNLKVCSILLMTVGIVNTLESSRALANGRNISNVMGVQVEKELIDKNYSKGEKVEPKYIVIHDTDNRKLGADAMANRNYFANHDDAKASAHYVVDEDSVIQVLEEHWKGWHIGDGGNEGISNSNTIGIELCVNKGNDFDKTLELGINLTKQLMEKYNIPPENVVTHNNCSGKVCPKMMLEDRPGTWEYFQSRIGLKPNGKNVVESVKESKGSNSKVNNAPKEELNKKGNIINVKSTINLRKGPSTSTAAIGKLKNGQDLTINYRENGWMNVTTPSGVTGFIKEDYIKITGDSTSVSNTTSTEKSLEKNEHNIGKVVGINTTLQVRKGQGTEYLSIGKLQPNEQVKVINENDGWYKILFLSNNTEKVGYVSSKYIKLQ